jgi:hypothetical protein
MTKSAPTFVRFVSADPHSTVDAELGMFTARDRIDFRSQRGAIQRAHDEAWYWFSSSGGGGLHLPRLQGKARTREVRKSLFWFKAEAAFFGHEKGSVVRRARQLAAVLTEAGVEIRELQSTDPGTIVWQDTKQVLALPTTAVERAFRI